jgi:hypothetical protein
MAIHDDLSSITEAMDRFREENAQFREENARFMGRIEQKVDGLKETVDQREDYAARYRADTRNKLEGVRQDVAAVATSVKEMKPVVAALTNLRAKATGAVVVLASLGAFMGWLIATFADDVRTFVGRLFFH